MKSSLDLIFCVRLCIYTFSRATISVLTLVITLSAVSAAAQAQLVDRLVAIVGEQAITLSDVRAARTFGFVSAGAGAGPGASVGAPGNASTSAGGSRAAGASGVASQTASGSASAAASGGASSSASSLTDEALVDKLVNRELMRAEIERFGMPQPPPEALDTRVQEIRARFVSDAAWNSALETCGLSESRFRAWVADDWRIEQYLQQRFDAAAQPTDDEVQQYYLSREREFTTDGRSRPFDEVRDEARRRLTDVRRRTLVDEWLSGLRRRTEIVILPASRSR